MSNNTSGATFIELTATIVSAYVSNNSVPASDLPAAVLARFAPDRQLRLPMLPVNRSINLSNAVAVVVYEAWRQKGFAGGV